MEVIDLTESPPPSPKFHGKSNENLPKSLQLALTLNSAFEPEHEPHESDPLVLQKPTDENEQNQNQECEMSDLKLLENMQLEGIVDQPAAKNRKKYMFFYARGRLSKDHWTEREHELFLMGLVRYGKGHWTKIARHFVGTKTPQQVSTYALAFFKRLPITYLYAFKRKRPSLDFANPTELFPATTTTTDAASDQTETPPADAASIHGQTMQQPDYEPPQTLILFPVEAPLFPVAEPNAAATDNNAASSFGAVDDQSVPMEELTLGLPAFSTNYSMGTSDELDLELRLG